MKKHSIKSGGIAFLLKCGKKQNWAIDKKVEFTKKKDKIISECYCTYTSGRMKFFCLQIGGTKPQYSKKILLILLYAKMDMACWQLKHFSSTTLPWNAKMATGCCFCVSNLSDYFRYASTKLRMSQHFDFFILLHTLISNLISMWYVCTFFQKSCSVPYQPPKSVAHLKVLAETLTFW